MTVQLAPPIVFQSFLSTGAPNAFGIVATYIAGTATPQATYVDSTQTTQNLNPTPLNALGQASIWLATNLVYKIVVFDVLGNQINFQDQIAGGINLTQQVIGQLLYPQTAAEIAAGVTPTNYAYPPGNVLRYGADPLGVSNSVTAFNSAIASNTSFCVVPSGTYLLNSNTNVGLWQVSAGVTFTGAGTILGKYTRNFGASGAFVQQLVSNFETPTQLIGFDVEQGLYQTGTISALQFGQTTELFTPSTSTTIWNGQLNSVYGSTSHFGSGSLTNAFGGAFEAFNSGPATATLIQGVNGNAWNGGVAAGIPVQSPTNNGNTTNMRGVAGFCSNLSTGTVTSAQSLYAATITNTGGGTITTAVGVAVADQTAGGSNYGVRTGLGQNYFGDCVRVAGSTNLPAATGGQFFMSGGFASPSNGRIYVGDGSGWRIEFAKRTASTDTVLASINDAGGLGIFGTTPPASQTTGFGTPTGNSVINNFPGASATLAQTSATVAEILVVLKSMGIIGN